MVLLFQTCVNYSLRLVCDPLPAFKYIHIPCLNCLVQHGSRDSVLKWSKHLSELYYQHWQTDLFYKHFGLQSQWDDMFSWSTPRLDTKVARSDTYLGSPLHPQWWCSPQGFLWGWRTCTWKRQTAGEHDQQLDWAEPHLPPKMEVLSHPSCAEGKSHSLMFMERPEALTDLDFISNSYCVTHIPCCLPKHNEAGKTLIFIT